MAHHWQGYSHSHVLTSTCTNVWASLLDLWFLPPFYFVLLFVCFVCIISLIQPDLLNIRVLSRAPIPQSLGDMEAGIWQKKALDYNILWIVQALIALATQWQGKNLCDVMY